MINLRKTFEETGEKGFNRSKNYNVYYYLFWIPLFLLMIPIVYISDYFRIPIVIGGIFGFLICILLCAYLLKFFEKTK